jgi:hypothetical protein
MYKNSANAECRADLRAENCAEPCAEAFAVTRAEAVQSFVQMDLQKP